MRVEPKHVLRARVQLALADHAQLHVAVRGAPQIRHAEAFPARGGATPPLRGELWEEERWVRNRRVVAHTHHGRPPWCGVLSRYFGKYASTMAANTSTPMGPDSTSATLSRTAKAPIHM